MYHLRAWADPILLSLSLFVLFLFLFIFCFFETGLYYEHTGICPPSASTSGKFVLNACTNHPCPFSPSDSFLIPSLTF